MPGKTPFPSKGPLWRDAVSKSKRERREKEAIGLADPDFILQICQEVYEGQALSQIATTHGIRYWVLHDWIHSDEDRLTHYQNADRARRDYFRDRSLIALQQVAFGDIRSLFNPDGSLKPVDQMTPDMGGALHSIDVHEGPTGNRTVKVRMSDRLDAIKTLSNIARSESEYEATPERYEQGEMDSMRTNLARKMMGLAKGAIPVGEHRAAGTRDRPVGRQIRRPISDQDARYGPKFTTPKPKADKG